MRVLGGFGVMVQDDCALYREVVLAGSQMWVE